MYLKNRGCWARIAIEAVFLRFEKRHQQSFFHFNFFFGLDANMLPLLLLQMLCEFQIKSSFNSILESPVLNGPQYSCKIQLFFLLPH